MENLIPSKDTLVIDGEAHNAVMCAWSSQSCARRSFFRANPRAGPGTAQQQQQQPAEHSHQDLGHLITMFLYRFLFLFLLVKFKIFIHIY